ncbi:MAG: GNAT family N-acetyltransferase [Rhizobiales bacterium]|nr:GNAT family N-acetyltransferase [Hyphomicrobiales bacterium]
MVKSGSEVDEHGLHWLMKQAKRLAMHFDKGTHVATAGIKIPRDSYRKKVFDGANAELSPQIFRYELGWVVVAESHRRRGLSRLVVEAALSEFGNCALFATSEVSNTHMHRTLSKFNFSATGTARKSSGD